MPIISEQTLMIIERKLRRGLWIIGNDKMIDQIVAWWRQAPFAFHSANFVYEMWKTRVTV